MKIAYLTNQYPKTSHSFIRCEIVALEAQGFTVVRFSIRDADEPLVHAQDVLEAERTRVILHAGLAGLAVSLILTFARRPFAWLRAFGLALAMGWRSDRGVLRHVAYLGEACVLLRWMRRDAVEHLHAHFGTNPPAVALLARTLGGPPYSFTVHGVDGEAPKLLSLPQKIASARFVVAVSYHGLSQLLRSCPPDQISKVHLVRCGVDGAFLDDEPTPVPADARLVCVARLSKEKGHLLLVQAVAQLQRERIPCELVLIGDGTSRSAIEAAISDAGLADRIHLRGWLSAEKVKAEIQAARALVLPSFSEGLPVAIMEALALGRPVISTYIAGIPELVVPRENGWLVPAGALEELVAAMREALTLPPATLAAMGRQGARRVATQHDADRESEKLAQLFTSGALVQSGPHTAWRERPSLVA